MGCDSSRSHSCRDNEMPPPPPATRDTSVATLLRRAHGRNSADVCGVVTPRALLAMRPVAVKLLTLTAPQLLIQQIHDTQVLDHPPTSKRAELDPFDFEDLVEGQHVGSRSEDGKIEQLLSELQELRDALGPDDACVSTTERHYLRQLHENTVLSVARQVISSANEPHAADSRGTHSAVFEALLTLSVKPTALAREIAFSLLHDVIQAVSTWCAMSTSHTSAHLHVSVNPLSRLFGLCEDMLTKSVAVASTSTPTAHSTDFSIHSPHYAWMISATNCLTALLKHRSSGYRQDRLVRLDASTMSFLLRSAFTFPTASGHETELQDSILEIVICGLYAQHEARGSNAGRKSLAPPPDPSEFPISVADVDKVGGLDLLLTIFYSTRSESSRRLILVVIFDLTLEQLKNTKRREDEESWAPSYESLLQCLHDADFAALVTQTPLAFAAGRSHSVAKIMHGAVENELLEKHVDVFWSAMRATLQIDEYFVHSASLSNAIKVAAHATSLQPTTNESLAEMIVAKAEQLILSSKMEDRFKGERWLAELLVYGLPCESGDTTDIAAHGGEHLLGASGAGPAEDPMEETFCFDEGAEIRLFARAKLWELAKSPSLAKRVAFANVLSLFTRRRVHVGVANSVVTDHLRELQPCLSALVAANEQSVVVLATMVETLLLLVVSKQEVPFLDLQRLKYDSESCDSAVELVGALVGSDSLASKLLRGTVSLDVGLANEIPAVFLVHSLAVFDESLHCVSSSGCQGGSCGAVVSLTGDYAVVTALLVSLTVDSSSSPQIHVLARYLDACDTRIAVIMARAVTKQLKREYGEHQYASFVRELHAAAVDQDDESSLANEVAHARAVPPHHTPRAHPMIHIWLHIS